MRILMVPHAYWPSLGGVERVVQQLARFLRADGHEVGILTDTHTDAPAQEVEDSIPIWRLRFVGWSRSNALRFWANWPSACRSIQQIVGEFHPDIVHMHVTSQNGPYAELAARTAQCPLVITTHGSFRRTLNPSGLVAEARLCRFAAALTHCSQAALEQFALKHPELWEKSQVIYNGVVLEDFAATPHSIRESGVVFAGRLHPQKGVDVLLEAWRQLGNPQAGLFLAGDGSEREALRRQCDRLCLKNVIWAGEQPYDQMVHLLKSASVFVVPSRDEGFPMSVLEAMAAGCPIVATCVGGIPEQIENGIHGLLVPPEDPQALASAIQRLLSERDFARSLGAQAAQRAATEFHWSKIARQYVAVYSGQPADEKPGRFS